jgi:integrase
LIGGKGYLFSTDGGVTPISGFSKFKAAHDLASGVADWRIHDLRRTARSLLSRAGIMPDIAERCLAHKISGVRGVYDRYEFLKEKREALAKLAALVGRIVK